MAILIDGYNLLNASGIVGRGARPTSLATSRLALLNFVAESLPTAQVTSTTFVFDSGRAPPGLPRVLRHRGLGVRFASTHEDADSLIEELIQSDSAPRKLTVVSSDHRLHRAARRRRASAVDSDVWYAELIRLRNTEPVESPQARVAPSGLLSPSEVEYWLRWFGEASEQRHADEDVASTDSIFPPGYAEDLLE